MTFPLSLSWKLPLYILTWFKRLLKGWNSERHPLQQLPMLWPKRVWFIFRTDLIKMQHLSAYTPAGPADVSITQSITLDFGKATFMTPEQEKICWAHCKVIQLYQVSLQELNSIIEKMWPSKPNHQRIVNLYKTQQKNKE